MKKHINLVCFFLLFTKAFCQTTQQEYVVISIEDSYKITQHGEQKYFWIISADSISSFDSQLSRLFISDFSVNNFADCCLGNATDPVVVTEDSNFILDEEFLLRLELLKNIIVQNKKKVQIITKKWEMGQVEKIKVFATAIIGEFCYCKYHPIGQQRTGYRGSICLPKSSSFQLSDKFWKTPAADFIIKRDYSELNFDIIPN